MRVSEQDSNGSRPSGKLPRGVPRRLPAISVQAPPPTLDAATFEAFRDMLDADTLSQIYREFLLTTRQRLEALPQMKDLEDLHKLAHTLKGTAGMLGASCIAARAAQLERDLPHAPDLPQVAQQFAGDCTALESALRGQQVSI